MAAEHAPGRGQDPAVWDIAAAHALLRRASRGEIDNAVWVRSPAAPVVAFGRTDARRVNFADAVAESRAAGFTPLIRAVGGHVLAYAHQAVLLDHVSRAADPGSGMHRRYESYAGLLAGVLRDLGVDARVGQVQGEYCPGAHSINARGVVKLAGIAQRVVKDAWMVSLVLITGGSAALSEPLASICRLLGHDFDPASVGDVRREEPTVGDEEIKDRIVDAVLASYPATQVVTAIDDVTWAEAAQLLDRHAVG